MTERSAPPPPTAPLGPPPGGVAPTPTPTDKGDATRPPAGPGADASSDDTAVRAGFAERLQAKITGNDGSESATSDDGRASRSKPRGPRRARLRLTRIDPWSVMKTAFLLSIAFGIVTVVAVAMIWQVLNSAGVWDSINSTIRDVVDSQGNNSFDIRDYVGTDRVLGFTMLVAAVDVILLTAIATLGAFLYNMAAALLGGIEVTLAEDH